jgi:hypothetical protein
MSGDGGEHPDRKKKEGNLQEISHATISFR